MMRLSVEYVECPNGERTRCERLTLAAVAAAEMEALHQLAALLTGGEPVQRVVRRLVEAAGSSAARTARVIAEAEALSPAGEEK